MNDEALDILTSYLRLDTTNPPGSEAPAARLLGSVFEREEIACEYIETAPGCEILLATLKGDGSRGKHLLLGNHTDVVPVGDQEWRYPPFGGVISDGRVYGRGAIDMKGLAVMQLMAMLRLSRERVPLGRDVVFCAVPDEEVASEFGMVWLCAHRPDVMDAAAAINEGGASLGALSSHQVPIFEITTSEKGYALIRLRASGTPGHASVPRHDNAIVRLALAMGRPSDWPQPVQLTAQTRSMFRILAEADLLPDGSDGSQLETALLAHPELDALVRNTFTPTILRAGEKDNVIPSTAEATFDLRTVPGSSLEQLLEEMRSVVADPTVTVEQVYEPEPPAEDSPWDGELPEVIREVVTLAIPGALVVPSMMWGATDSRFLRRLGVPAYGFFPWMLTPEERQGFHSHDEFLHVDNLSDGCDLMYEVVRRFSAKD